MKNSARYRFAIKLDRANKTSLYGSAAIGWAVLSLRQEIEPIGSGQGAMFDPTEVPELHEVQEVRVVAYTDPADIIGPPTTLEQHEARVQDALRQLPQSVLVQRVLFDRAAYNTWRAGRPDTSQARAEWANSLP